MTEPLKPNDDLEKALAEQLNKIQKNNATEKYAIISFYVMPNQDPFEAFLNVIGQASKVEFEKTYRARKTYNAAYNPSMN